MKPSTTRDGITEDGKKPLPISGGGRHRPFWKLTDDPLLRHGIRRERQQLRANKNKPMMKGIVGSIATEKIPYPPLRGPEKERRPGQPRGLSGAEKRRKRKGGNPKGGPGGGGTQGALRRLRVALDQAKGNPQVEAEG